MRRLLFLVFSIICFNLVTVFAADDSYVSITELCNAEVGDNISFTIANDMAGFNTSGTSRLTWKSDTTDNVYVISILGNYITMYRKVDGLKDYFEVEDKCTINNGNILIPVSLLQESFGFNVIRLDDSKVYISEAYNATYDLTEYGVLKVNASDTQPMNYVMNTGTKVSGLYYKGNSYIKLRDLCTLNLYDFSDINLLVDDDKKIIDVGWFSETNSDYFVAAVSTNGVLFNKRANNNEQRIYSNDKACFICVDGYNYMSTYYLNYYGSIVTVEDIASSSIYIPGTYSYDMYSTGVLASVDYVPSTREYSAMLTYQDGSLDLDDSFTVTEDDLRELKEMYGENIINKFVELSSSDTELTMYMFTLALLGYSLNEYPEYTENYYNSAKLVCPVQVDTTAFGDGFMKSYIDQVWTYIQGYGVEGNEVNSTLQFMANILTLSIGSYRTNLPGMNVSLI